MSETIAITGKSVKLFKGHYTSSLDGHSDDPALQTAVGTQCQPAIPGALGIRCEAIASG
ncbi:MAG: hypothetical protein ACREYE_07295 [Gammaproteobacteria bacterium]